MFDKIKLLQFKEKLELLGYSERTVSGYLEEMRHFFRFLEEEENLKSLAKLRPEQVRAYQIYLPTVISQYGKPLSQVCVIKRLTALRMFLRIMHEEKLLSFDYAACICLPRLRKTLPKNIPDIETMRKLIEAPPLHTPTGLRDRCMMELLYTTGIRNTELRTLTIDRVNFTDNTILVTGKGAKDRVVPLCNWMLPYLKEYLKNARAKIIRRNPSGLLFPTLTGRQMNMNVLCRIIRRWEKRARIPMRITPHAFRHACATHMLQAGADIRYVQELLGHVSLVSTQIYTHVTIKDLKEAHRKYHPREAMNHENL